MHTKVIQCLTRRPTEAYGQDLLIFLRWYKTVVTKTFISTFSLLHYAATVQNYLLVEVGNARNNFKVRLSCIVMTTHELTELKLPG